MKMKSRFFASIAFSVCAVASQAQTYFTINEPGAHNSFIQVADFGLSRFHPEEELTDSNFRTYRPGRPVFGNITFKCKLDNEPEMDRWFKKVLDGKVDRKSISVIFHNDQGQEAQRYNFFECWPTRIMLPGCDTSSTTPAGMEVSFATTHFERGDRPTEPQVSQQKTWLPANFRLKIDGLDQPCTRVNKIEAIVIKQLAQIGGDLDGDGEPDYTTSDLVFSLPNADASGFLDWFDNGGARNGSLSYLDTDGSSLKTVRIRITCGEIAVDTAKGKTTVHCPVMKLTWSPQSN